MFDHARLVIQHFPAVLAAKPQRIGMAGHQAVGVAEGAHRIAIAVVHAVQLAIAVVVVAHQRFDRLAVNDAFDGAQAVGHFVVAQVHALPAGGADVGQYAVFTAHKMQKMPEGVFDAFQRHRLVVVGYFAEVVENVVQRLHQVMTAVGAHQVQLFLCVVDALVVVQRHERHAAALIVAEVQKAALAAQALFPRQYPAFAQHAVDIEVAGVEACPLDGHPAGQAEVELVDQQFAPGGGVHRVAVQAAEHFFRQRGDAKANDGIAQHDAAHKTQRTRASGFEPGLQAQLGDAAHSFGTARDHQQNVHGVAGCRRHFIVHRQVAMGAAANEHVVGAGADFCAAGQFVAFARGRLAVDEHIAGAFGHLDDGRVLFAHRRAVDGKRGGATVDEHVGRARFDLPRRRAEGGADTLPEAGNGITGQTDRKTQ
ncbi:Uncharacterized protein AC506_4657 [Pseudomonas syringae pv. maculicola str. M6]|nr:Uncharacterized protein AC506_4657 [Pseudomonas syringae pv. maculicola str. M6]